MVWAGLGAVAIGLCLGLLGSGGSIVTVPVLIYLAGEAEKAAIAESLGIVGLVSLAGAIPFARARSIHWWSVLAFGAPGAAGTWIGASLSRFVAAELQLLGFALVLFVAAASLLRGGAHRAAAAEGAEGGAAPPARARWRIAVDGLVVGALTGLVGVGGGFLIVPALVVLGGLPMRLAIGTSLAIIALKSLVGFYAYVGVLAEARIPIDGALVLGFAGLGAIGGLVGARAGRRLPQTVLRRVFAVALLLVGAGIVGQRLWALGAGA